jgi:hypothetical protein
MTKGHLLNHTLYGVDIINHIVRLEYPEHTTIVKGDDCGEAPDPIHRDGTIIAIAVEKTFISQRELPDRCAKVHFNDGTLPDCDAIEFAVLYYKSIGTPKTETEVISILATDLCIKEQRCFRIEREHEQKGHADKNVTVSFSMPPTHKMSFYRRPIRNTKPIREASPQDIFKYLISDYAKANTEQCRAIKDSKERSKFKASNFDYITPAGIFSSRNEKDIVRLNGYIVIDFDHVPAPEELVIKLANDINFETVLAFRSPSGDGVKWIVARNLELTKDNGIPYTHEEFFRILSNYSRKIYGVEADPSGKDICRACFLPYDPQAFINPLYLDNNYSYDYTRFL